MNPSFRIRRLPALQDNLLPLIEDPGHGRAAVVDPATAAGVIEALEAGGMALEVVLLTHHHQDHIGGVEPLRRRWPGLQVLGAAADQRRLPRLSRGLRDGDCFQLFGRTVQVLAVPAHTRHHIAYVLPATGQERAELFCGDTLFMAGCGRLFEGTPADLSRALQRLAELPDETRVWCAHEYSSTNLAFALEQEPANHTLVAQIERVKALRQAGLYSVPSSIGLERAINPFMRVGEPALQQATGQRSAVQVLRVLRQRKDTFKPAASPAAGSPRR
ncbi:MAG: hydroxyacylglutathione hydrolase [Aphanocapsa feldmannii 277cV]|uniref:Hydroxyacylglutathione hydrolase n=2 Tax=Aphanocapsa feldmannii TaxID=192050 RepID=A0A524RQ79_9CHRO|nr:MAG: hydroxyacylglutathione hydrolase [Aphanocapsa feldmannii 277cV]TGH21104.1 MAG: hydroxyacylglutathione hydrolase [Aphanocapsa feldmannii 277cI]